MGNKNFGNQIGGIFMNMIPGLLNTGLSLIKDKRVPRNGVEYDLMKDDEGNYKTSFIHKAIDKGISLSGTKIGGYGISAMFGSMAVQDITANGITKQNVALAGITAFVFVMSGIVSAYKDKA